MKSSTHGVTTAIAILCGSVELREDGLLNVLGILGPNYLIAPGYAGQEQDRSTTTHQMMAFLMLRGVRNGPSGRLRLAIEHPNRDRDDGPTVLVEWRDAVVQAMGVPLGVVLEESGAHRIDVFYDDVAIATIPLVVQYSDCEN